MGENIVQSNTIVKKIGMGLHYTARKKLLWLTAPPYDLNLNGKLNDCPVPRRKHLLKDIPLDLKMGSGAYFILSYREVQGCTFQYCSSG